MFPDVSCLKHGLGAVRILRGEPSLSTIDLLWTSVYHGKQSGFHLKKCCELDSLLEPGPFWKIMGGVLKIWQHCGRFKRLVWGGNARRGGSNERELSLNQITEAGKSQWILI
jgi:hypothetical protein